jgi:tetratricopeptide (TPR) repeat protein
MIRTPLRLLFLGLVICALLGVFFDFLNNQFAQYPNSLLPEFKLNNIPATSLARYYWSIGRFDEAIEEYQSLILTLPQNEIAPAYNELNQLILVEKSTRGKILSGIAYYAWLLPPKLYGLAFLFFLLALAYYVYRSVKKGPKFLFQTFHDYTGLNIGSNLPQIAIDRIHEISWRAQNIQSASNFIADNVEVPTLDLMSEGDNQSAVEFLETALKFSIGSSNLPLSHLTGEIRLWLAQPLYLVRGSIEKSKDAIELKMLLVNNKKNYIEKTWCTIIPSEEDIFLSKIVDAVIYPLLLHFNNVGTTCWNALHALHDGLEEIQLFRDDHLTQSHIQVAQQQLERALSIDPGYSLAKYNLSLLLLTIGEFDKARDYLKELSDSAEDAQLRLRANYNYGVALFHLSQDWAYEQAVKVFQDLLTKVKNDQLDQLIRGTLSTTYAKMALRHPKEKKTLVRQSLDEADRVLEDIEVYRRKRKGFEKTHDYEETKANALAAKGFAHMALEKYKQAIEYFQQAVRTHPASPSCLLGLGEAYFRSGDKDKALDSFKKAAVQSPLSGYTNYRLGKLYREMGEHEKAIETLQRASVHAYARLTLGKIYLEDEELEKALDEFRQATCLNSRLSEAWASIAWTILQMNNDALLTEALAAARHSLQFEKNEKQLWHRHSILAACLLNAGKDELANKEANKAVELSPNRAQAYYYLALAQYRLEQYTTARQSIQKTIDLDKTNDWKTKAVKLLQELSKVK